MLVPSDQPPSLPLSGAISGCTAQVGVNEEEARQGYARRAEYDVLQDGGREEDTITLDDMSGLEPEPSPSHPSRL